MGGASPRRLRTEWHILGTFTHFGAEGWWRYGGDAGPGRMKARARERRPDDQVLENATVVVSS